MMWLICFILTTVYNEWTPYNATYLSSSWPELSLCVSHLIFSLLLWLLPCLIRHLSIYSGPFSICLLATSLCRGCEKNEASYNVFQLDAFVNTTAISNLKQFPKVTQAIDAIDVSERTLLSLTQTIQNILESMLQTSSFNLTTYRATIGAPTPEKDLATFIDQMQRVALQVSFCGIVKETINFFAHWYSNIRGWLLKDFGLFKFF